MLPDASTSGVGPGAGRFSTAPSRRGGNLSRQVSNVVAAAADFQDSFASDFSLVNSVQVSRLLATFNGGTPIGGIYHGAGFCINVETMDVDAEQLHATVIMQHRDLGIEFIMRRAHHNEQKAFHYQGTLPSCLGGELVTWSFSHDLGNWEFSSAAEGKESSTFVKYGAPEHYRTSMVQLLKTRMGSPAPGITVAKAMPARPPAGAVEDFTRFAQEEGLYHSSSKSHSKPSQLRRQVRTKKLNYVREENVVLSFAGSATKRDVPEQRCSFFDEAQIGLLMETRLPVDYYALGIQSELEMHLPEGLVEVPSELQEEQAAAAVATPVVTAHCGFPILDTSKSGLSAARTEYDGWQGIKTYDHRVHHNFEQIILFLSTYNTRPVVRCQVHGWHMEDCSRDEGSSDHVVQEKVDDFIFRLDLTAYIFPYGYMQSVDGERTAMQVCERFIKDRNLLKALEMVKEVHFDWKALELMIIGYMRHIGWHAGLTVTFPCMNKSVTIYSRNACSEVWASHGCRFLSDLCILPSLAFRLYRGDLCNSCGITACGEEHYERDIRSVFKIRYTPLEVFALIRKQLRNPGFQEPSL